MLALSIRQPYAELILREIKTVEYRTRPTRIIGERFYIYASKAKAARPIWSNDLRVATPPKWMLELAEQVGMIGNQETINVNATALNFGEGCWVTSTIRQPQGFIFHRPASRPCKRQEYNFNVPCRTRRVLISQRFRPSSPLRQQPGLSRSPRLSFPPG